MGGGLLEVDVLVEQLVTDLSESGRTAYRPKDVVELVTTAAGTVFERDRRDGQFPIGCPVRAKVVAKEPARRDLVRRGQG